MAVLTKQTHSSAHREVLGAIVPPNPEMQATSAPALSLHTPITDGSHQPLVFRLLLLLAKPQTARKHLVQDSSTSLCFCFWGGGWEENSVPPWTENAQ